MSAMGPVADISKRSKTAIRSPRRHGREVYSVAPGDPLKLPVGGLSLEDLEAGYYVQDLYDDLTFRFPRHGRRAGAAASSGARAAFAGQAHDLQRTDILGTNLELIYGATDKGTKINVVYVVEKGQPLVSPAP
jgi:hypothetical protein